MNSKRPSQRMRWSRVLRMEYLCTLCVTSPYGELRASEALAKYSLALPEPDTRCEKTSVGTTMGLGGG